MYFHLARLNQRIDRHSDPARPASYTSVTLAFFRSAQREPPFHRSNNWSSVGIALAPAQSDRRRPSLFQQLHAPSIAGRCPHRHEHRSCAVSDAAFANLFVMVICAIVILFLQQIPETTTNYCLGSRARLFHRFWIFACYWAYLWDANRHRGKLGPIPAIFIFDHVVNHPNSELPAEEVPAEMSNFAFYCCCGVCWNRRTGPAWPGHNLCSVAVTATGVRRQKR